MTDFKTNFGDLTHLLGLAIALKNRLMGIVPILSASGSHGPLWSFVSLSF